MNNSIAEILKDVLNHKPKERFMDDNILIVDGMNTFIRGYCGANTCNFNGIHIGGICGFFQSINYALDRFKSTRCIVVFDGPGGSQAKRKIYPEYKLKRHMAASYNRRDDVDSEDNSKWQLNIVYELLEYLPITTIAIPYVEGDDVISEIAKYKKDSKITIMSTDVDFLQLANDHIQIWSPMKKKVYDSSRVLDEYGVHPNNFIFQKIISGDNSDNIPGVERFGPKTVIKYFPILADSDKKNIDILFECIQEKKGKLVDNFNNSRELLERNYKIMNLDKPLISGSATLKIHNMVDLKPNKLNEMNFKIDFLKYGLDGGIRNLNTLMHIFNTLNVLAYKES